MTRRTPTLREFLRLNSLTPRKTDFLIDWFNFWFKTDCTDAIHSIEFLPQPVILESTYNTVEYKTQHFVFSSLGWMVMWWKCPTSYLFQIIGYLISEKSPIFRVENLHCSVEQKISNVWIFLTQVINFVVLNHVVSIGCAHLTLNFFFAFLYSHPVIQHHLGNWLRNYGLHSATQHHFRDRLCNWKSINVFYFSRFNARMISSTVKISHRFTEDLSWLKKLHMEIFEKKKLKNSKPRP